MKAKRDTAATIRAIIRWTTGTVVAAAITIGSCLLFPLLSSVPAIALTICLSVFVGLNIALPPLDPEEDWVPIRSKAEEEKAVKETLSVISEKKAGSQPAPVAEPVPGIGILPVHIRRSSGAPTGTWHVIHPGLTHEETAHMITLSHHRKDNRHLRHQTHSPARKSG